MEVKAEELEAGSHCIHSQEWKAMNPCCCLGPITHLLSQTHSGRVCPPHLTVKAILHGRVQRPVS